MGPFYQRVGAVLLAVLASAFTSSVSAQGEYPSRYIKWIVPNPAGGGTDAVMRVIADAVAPTLGQQLVIENRPGASTMIGAEAAARSAPDGYTLLTGDTATFSTNKHLYKKVPYDAEKDFTPIALLARFPLVLVVKPSSPFNSVGELIAFARANPDKLSYATPGTGLPHHLAMELFMERTGARMTHVPYRGSPPALTDLAAGRLDVMFVDLASGQAFIKDGRVRALASATGKRLGSLPEVMTMDEAGVKTFEVYAWQGVVAPANTPLTIIQRLSKEFALALGSPSVQKRMLEIGVEPLSGGPKEFSEYARAESKRWGDLIAAKAIRLE